jgi:hypothetical protein
MFNFDGQLVADALFIQRMGDTLQGVRDHRAAIKAEEMQQLQLFADEQRYAWLVAQYNNLADRYNGVLADNKRVDAAYADALAEKDRHIARLSAENAELAAEKEEANESALKGWQTIENIREGIERNKIKMGDAWPPELRPIREF